jgi:predicted aspartyl protease
VSYSYKYRAKGISAPFLSVNIQNPLDESKKLMCEALLDTGSDISYFPEWLLTTKLNIVPSGGPVEVEGIGGQNTYFVYLAFVTINSKSLTKKVLGWEKEFALVGCDILNTFCIEFNGPYEEFRFITSTSTSNATSRLTWDKPFRSLSRFFR